MASDDAGAEASDTKDGDRSSLPLDSASDRAGAFSNEGIRSRSGRVGLVRQSSKAKLSLAANLDDTNVEMRQDIKIRKQAEAKAGSKKARYFWRSGRKESTDEVADVDGDKTQYTVKQKKTKFKSNFLTRFWEAFCFGSAHELMGGGRFTFIGRAFANHLNWLFSTSFLAFFSYALIMFYLLVFLFAGFITWAGNARPECVLVGGLDFGHAGTQFADAFSLSWHTFSTVGYGAAYPALSDTETSEKVCAVISLIAVIESFTGVMYGAIIGSILFGKIDRITSRAQVVFSDPLLVRYGRGLSRDVDEDEDEDEEEEGEKFPCPVLEFRIVNRLHNQVGGEILDASIQVIASLDAEGPGTALQNSAGLIDPTKLVQVLMNQTAAMAEPAGSDHGTEDTDNYDKLELGNVNVGHGSAKTNALRSGFSKHSMLSSSVMKTLNDTVKDFQHVEEDPTGSLVPSRVFMNVEIESSEHPFFKRVWIIRHTLDDSSPLLTHEARRRVRKNGGHWPDEMNSPGKVRDSLLFNQILVSLNGVSNVSGADIFAQKIYDYVDLAVGYHFVNLLYKGKDENLEVDVSLINDVREQAGGGGEDLLNR